MKGRAGKRCTRQVGSLKDRTGEGRPAHVGAREIGAYKDCRVEVGPGEVRPRHGCVGQVGLPEGDPAQVGAGEVCANQVLAGETLASQVLSGVTVGRGDPSGPDEDDNGRCDHEECTQNVHAGW